jgi:hypothetical protein
MNFFQDQVLRVPNRSPEAPVRRCPARIVHLVEVRLVGFSCYRLKCFFEEISRKYHFLTNHKKIFLKKLFKRKYKSSKFCGQRKTTSLPTFVGIRRLEKYIFLETEKIHKRNFYRFRNKYDFEILKYIGFFSG